MIISACTLPQMRPAKMKCYFGSSFKVLTLGNVENSSVSSNIICGEYPIERNNSHFSL